MIQFLCMFFFFFNDTATTEIYTLSLHDALPICLISSILAFAICMACPSLTLMVLVSPVTLSVTSLLLLMSGMVLCRACFKRLIPSYRRNSPRTAYLCQILAFLWSQAMLYSSILE